MKCSADKLFSSIGKGNDFYSEVQAGLHRKHSAIQNYINNTYDKNQEYLDKDFPKKFPNEFEQRLWELRLCEYLRQNSKIKLLPRSSYCQNDQSAPDFCFIHDERKYFVEAVTVGPGECKELSISLQDALGLRTVHREMNIWQGLHLPLSLKLKNIIPVTNP